MSPLVSNVPEEKLLEQCLVECKHKLDARRRMGDEIQVALIEADMNDILEKLLGHYRDRPKQ